MANYTELSDQKLAFLLKQGDHAAFSEVYDRYWQALYLHALKMLRDPDDAMDVVQDVFTTIWKKCEETLLNTSVKAYLYTSVRNQTIKMINRGKLRDKFILAMAESMSEGIEYVDDQINFNELSALIENEIQLLPPKMRTIFVMSRTEGLSHKEIAEALDISENTVKTTIHRGLNILRSKFTLSAGALWVLLHS
ncbi:RNA polymerase sigma factor [Desertivirga xinjiangensis]|uniref:RNA polymerase sigma factor n=1 Tax=Desertivirga xinjiangensis TaxID=539206 RepID=UPI00210A7CEB|nr:RNA polymerase sigma-70 factor [Pedobacter xinjiangensis]